jgi:hypothetical protein
VIPDTTMLQKAWRRGLVRQQLEKRIGLLRADAERDAEAAGIPADLGERVRKKLKEDPLLSWDEAVAAALAEPEGDAR